jgi:iron-sulfur cluster assembly protein
MASRIITTTVRTVAAKKRPVLQKSALVLTSAAINQVKNLIKNQENVIGLKIGVKTRGCNGQSYTLQYVKERDKGDEVVDQDGLKIFIDRKALMHVLGTEMDYVEEKLSSGFVFSNPNIKGTCGCGESFSI